MYSGRKRSSSKSGFPFALIGIFFIVVCTIVINKFLLPQSDVLVSYLLSVNIAAFIAFGLDKILAAQHTQRVPEKVLFIACLIGGTFAALTAMYLFRHKTQKGSFQATLGGILFLQVVILAIVYNMR